MNEARPAWPASDPYSTPPPGPAGMTMQPLGTQAPRWLHESRCPLHDLPPDLTSAVGDFNDWNPFAHPLRRRANGTRSAAVTVPADSMLHFRYLAEGGVWFDDDTAPAWDGQDPGIAV